MALAVRSGDIIAGNYRVERVLGTGGMGVVVAARHVDTGELRAVKIMNREPVDGAGWASRFRREALVGQRLQSEHAVHVYEAGGFDEGQPWLVMEHLEGTDLGKLLRRRGPLPVDEAAAHVVAACDAISEAHDLGVVHRDLKPANLFLARRPDGSTCLKVLDFGISKVSFGEDPAALAVTQTGEVIGSPAYMAPEQIRSFGQVDPRSDVWALGVILFELCTGKWPFPGKASVEMIAMVLERRPDPPSKYRAGLPAAFEALLMRCLEKDLEQRTPSARVLAAALEPFLAAVDDRPTPTLPPRARAPLADAPLEGAPLTDAPPSPPAITAPPPVSLPPASTASQAVQRTVPIEAPRADGPSPRAVYFVAAAALSLVALTTLVLVRRARPAPDESVVVASASAQPPAEIVGAPAIAPSTPAAPSAEASAEPVTTADPSSSADPITSADPSASPARPGRLGAPQPGPVTVEPRAGDGRHVDQLAASAALGAAAGAARRCKRPGGPTGSARVDVSFAPSGRVSSVRIGGPFEGTPVGKCIRAAFSGISVPPFQGSTFSAGKTVTIK